MLPLLHTVPRISQDTATLAPAHTPYLQSILFMLPLLQQYCTIIRL